eukprot:760290-Hanusia_phi.AAC.3
MALQCVSEVNKEHKDVVAYEPEEEGGAGGAGAGDARSSSKSAKPSIIEGFKPNNNLVPILGGTKDTFYTEEQVDDCMISNLYVKFKEEDRPALVGHVDNDCDCADLAASAGIFHLDREMFGTHEAAGRFGEATCQEGQTAEGGEKSLDAITWLIAASTAGLDYRGRSSRRTEGSNYRDKRSCA